MTLGEVRTEIDRVDGQIKELFAQRMRLADNVAAIKAETADAIFKPDREEIIISSLTKDVDSSIVKEYTALIKRIMEISRKYQYGRTLALRDCFPFSYETEAPAVDRLAMRKQELYICDMYSKDRVVTVNTFDEIGSMVSGGSVSAGAGILENISFGVSDALHQMLTKYKLYINGCYVREEDGVMKKVAVFSKKLVVLPNHNRLKIVFVCPNRSGSLSSILSMISDYGVNLTEIHSLPNGQRENWNYEFFLELDMNLLSQEGRALIFQLSEETEKLEILGSYEI
ncbi:MAG: chorismate mutase [Lachnospiraceae bacterium]|nr:chorismate mutase [Lachnospiraceae bacterium]